MLIDNADDSNAVGGGCTSEEGPFRLPEGQELTGAGLSLRSWRRGSPGGAGCAPAAPAPDPSRQTRDRNHPLDPPSRCDRFNDGRALPPITLVRCQRSRVDIGRATLLHGAYFELLLPQHAARRDGSLRKWRRPRPPSTFRIVRPRTVLRTPTDATLLCCAHVNP